MDVLSILADVAVPTSRSLLGSGTMAATAMGEAFSNLLYLAASILTIIGTWKILEKAGEQGWKSLIPFYNNYTLYKVFWEVKWFWISLIPAMLTFIGFFVSIAEYFVLTNALDASTASSIAGAITIMGCIFLIVGGSIFSTVLNIILNVKITKAFGKSGGFAVGMILFPPIFYMILGCGKDKYIGKKKK